MNSEKYKIVENGQSIIYLSCSIKFNFLTQAYFKSFRELDLCIPLVWHSARFNEQIG